MRAFVGYEQEDGQFAAVSVVRLAVPGRPIASLVLIGEPGDPPAPTGNGILQWIGPVGPLEPVNFGMTLGTGLPAPGGRTVLSMPEMAQGTGDYRVVVWDEQGERRLAEVTFRAEVGG